MRQIFRGYYRPTEEEFSELWEKCIFIPDANVLLNIYRYSPATCDVLINIFKEISERLWITHQAALEYHNNRLKVIETQESAYENIKEKLKELQNKSKKEFDPFLRHPFIDVKIFSEKINGILTEIENELDECKKKHPNLLKSDKLRDDISTLFEGKVGEPYPPEKLKKLFDEGKERYTHKIPPGYNDKVEDGENPYGDLILWFQIIDYAKSIKKPIIFITDDIKEDWWLKFKGKTIGPRPELIDEIYKKANVDFYMYQTEQFMIFAEKFIEREIDKEAIKEVQDIKQIDEEYRVKLLSQIKPENHRDYTDIDRILMGFAKVDESTRDFAKIYESAREFAKVDESVREFAKIYESARDFAKMCEGARDFKETVGDFAVITEKLKQVREKQESEND